MENITPRIKLNSGHVVEVGTLSHGTMLPCHVLPSLGTWLACFATGEVREAYRAIMDEFAADEDAAATLAGTPGRDFEHSAEVTCQFIDLVAETLPEGWTCATHPGDHSDIGIWPIELFD